MDAALPPPSVAVPQIPPRTQAGTALDASFHLRATSLQWVEYPDGGVGVYSPFGKEWLIVPAEVASVQCASTTKTVKKHPTWAIVVGILGLFLFLVGIVFFFVTETVQTPVYLVTVQAIDGRWLRFYSDIAIADR